MKVGLIWIGLLIGAVLVCPASAQSKSSPTQVQTPTYDEAIAIEDPAARITALQQILKNRPAAE